MLRIFALLASGSLAMGGAVLARETSFEWRGKVAAGQFIEVKGVNGDVRAEGTDSGEVEVIAQKTGRRSDPDQVEVRVLPHENGVTICAVYPGHPTECNPGRAQRSGTSRNDVKVHFTVRVPWGVRFVGRTVNGQVEAASMRSEVEAYTVNGRVRIHTSGSAHAETVNGSIQAQVGHIGDTRPQAFRTVNGAIVLELPPAADADLQAKTVNGAISADFPLEVKRITGSRTLHATLGRGGSELEVSTVNGSIQLRRNVI